jgi:hypothetical protein
MVKPSKVSANSIRVSTQRRSRTAAPLTKPAKSIAATPHPMRCRVAPEAPPGSRQTRSRRPADPTSPNRGPNGRKRRETRDLARDGAVGVSRTLWAMPRILPTLWPAPHCARWALAAVLGMIGCQERRDRPAVSHPKGASPSPMFDTPKPVFTECRRAPLLRPICPRHLPVVRTPFVARSIHGAPSLATLDIQSGALHADASPQNRPPQFAHVVLEAGGLTTAFETFSYPTHGTPVRSVDGLLESPIRRKAEQLATPKALFLGRFRWAGRSGSVVLVPTDRYVDAIVAGHLVFRWRHAGKDYAISLHGYEPLSRALATLQAIVQSLQH